MPAAGKIYSFNEGNYATWSPSLKQYMDSLKARPQPGFRERNNNHMIYARAGENESL